MTKLHVATVLLAFGSLAILPACSVTASRTSSAAPMSNPELSSGMVRQVQTALQQQGLYTGSIDGLWGPQTQSAVQSFQQSHALRPTGELNSPTLAALNVPASGAPTPVAPVAAAPADTTSSATPIAPAAPATAAPMPAVASTSTAPAVAPTP
jgi:peptidoglycan hydrolase-like protein with peptidoglycan-binding domain